VEESSSSKGVKNKVLTKVFMKQSPLESRFHFIIATGFNP
jgi:hypothetical protein